jgi:3-oxoacyl-[acyl-carrier protein] reductase
MKKVALITGGSRGIGLGIAAELAKAGFNLAINGVRDEKSVSEAVEDLKKYGGEVLYVQGDVSFKNDRERMTSTVISHFGKLNILINNAGVAPKERRDILEATEESFNNVLNINLKGPYFLTQQAANHMIWLKKKDPSQFCCIINVSSVSAIVVSTNRGEYCISKAGIAMATKLWAARLGEYDIPVYEIQPGVIKSDMTAGVQEKYNSLFQQGMAVQQRWGTPEDVGKVAASMCLGNLPYSTGQVVMVDGGMTIQRL